MCMVTRYRSMILALGLLVGLSASARADVIDATLVRHAEAITKAVRDMKAEKVAVLKFEVKLGNRPATFDAGLANTKLAQKLENLLVLTNDTENPLMVLTGAADRTSELPPGTTWKDEAGRKALCSLKGLPLAWDNKQSLTPDAYLAGLLDVSADLKSATITIYGFTTANPSQLTKLYTTPQKNSTGKTIVPSDRALLSLVGLSYSVEKTSESNAEGDQEALAKALAGMTQPASFMNTVKDAPVRLDILLNDREVHPTPDMEAPGGGRINGDSTTDPKVGDKITFQLTNTSPNKTYGVVLAVNGRNTNALSKNHDLNARDAKDQRMWVLGPNEKVTIPGFYNDVKGDYEPFKILGDAASRAAYPVLGEQYRGLITMHVFRQMPDLKPTKEIEPTKPTNPPVTPPKPPTPPTPPPMPPKTSGDPDEPPSEVEISLLSLGVGGNALSDVRISGSPESAKKQVQSLTNVASRNDGGIGLNPAKLKQDRGLIVGGTVQKSKDSLQVVDFRCDPSSIAFVQIRYYGR